MTSDSGFTRKSRGGVNENNRLENRNKVKGRREGKRESRKERGRDGGKDGKKEGGREGVGEIRGEEGPRIRTVTVSVSNESREDPSVPTFFKDWGRDRVKSSTRSCPSKK